MGHIRTYVAPDRCRVECIVAPHYSVNGQIKTSNRGPYHKETSSRIPSLTMPWQRNEHDDGAKDSEDRECWIGGIRDGSKHGERCGERRREELWG